MAQNIEDKNSALQNCFRATGPPKSGYPLAPSITTWMYSVPAKSSGSSQKFVTQTGPRFHTSGSVGSFPFKRLSEAKWKAKREKGLCFRCDEKYSIGHRCKNKELQVMMIHDKEIREAGGEEETLEGGEEE